ncbi:uncharacterized protein UV8b_07476 [Ustilaginoidea virens]|uniref:Secreted protein n=1 Tax=Ustilaginoidea virens TaxID=1159556 RepID=A0A8E5HXK0_USTVR|nr:uncharacterized protein UV8b_07476 [Ustilaginoidea virens]QUC23235.1 hypothetical protein UV8b_07476 [Ustilaginoidea virens]
MRLSLVALVVATVCAAASHSHHQVERRAGRRPQLTVDTSVGGGRPVDGRTVDENGISPVSPGSLGDEPVSPIQRPNYKVHRKLKQKSASKRYKGKCNPASNTCTFAMPQLRVTADGSPLYVIDRTMRGCSGEPCPAANAPCWYNPRRQVATCVEERANSPARTFKHAGKRQA